jgi:hypothetical protein
MFDCWILFHEFCLDIHDCCRWLRNGLVLWFFSLVDVLQGGETVVAALADSQAARNRDALLHSGRSAGEETLCLNKKKGLDEYSMSNTVLDVLDIRSIVTR